jgi:O-antigen ligase
MIRLAFPALLLLFFVWRSLNERVFLLGIPFLMYMADAVFLDRVRIFGIPGRLEPADHMMLWLVIVWVVYFDLLLPRRRTGEGSRQLLGPRPSTPEEIILGSLAAYCALEILLTILRFGSVGSAVGEAKGFIYLFAGYFLLRGILYHAGRTQTMHFLAALVGVNTLAALLFVAHQGLRLPIYDATEYQTITFMGQQLTRSFYFMPGFLILATAFSIAQKRWTVWWVAVFVITFAALWISYTRSLLVIAVVEVVVVLGVRLLKSREAGLAVRRALAIGGIVLLFAVAAFAVLPVQSQYLLSRIGMATASGRVTDDANLQNRERKMARVYDWIGDESHALGQGFASPAQNAPAGDVEWMAADLIWVPVLYRLGLVGLALIAALFATYAWRALSLGVTGNGDAEFLGLVFLGTLVGVFLEGFVSWTLLNPERYPMGLWLFALVAAEACRRRHETETGALEPIADAEAPGARSQTVIADLTARAGSAGD